MEKHTKSITDLLVEHEGLGDSAAERTYARTLRAQIGLKLMAQYPSLKVDQRIDQMVNDQRIDYRLLEEVTGYAVAARR